MNLNTILYELEKEMSKAQKRQKIGAKRDSGHMKGLRNAIKVIESFIEKENQITN